MILATGEHKAEAVARALTGSDDGRAARLALAIGRRSRDVGAGRSGGYESLTRHAPAPGRPTTSRA